MTNPSAFTVREIDNQTVLYPFRTTQIATSANYISGNGGTFNFHASGFRNRTLVHAITIVGNGLGTPNDFNIEFFMTSSLVSSERQYFNQNINLRTIDLAQYPMPIFDNDATGCLHGRVTNNAATSGMWLNYIDIKYNRMVEAS